ncbi:hypothetical protein MJL48_31770, partial [Salmonella enterica subsp. enterica serovar Kentucky]|nr:hypothetical protein [Salmonella enterica subsp. enterica serovar Kentucky]
CIAPAKPGGGFDLTCKLIQVSLLETGAIEKPMRVTYMPGGVGLRQLAVMFGLLAGTLLGMALGSTDFSGVGHGPLFSFPQLLPF